MSSINRSNFIFETMKNDRDDFESGFKIMREKEDVFKAIISQIMVELQNSINSKVDGLIFGNDFTDDNFKNAYPQLRIKSEFWKKDFWLTVESHKDWFNRDVAYGIFAPSLKEPLKIDFNDLFSRNGKNNHAWRWYYYLSDNEFNIKDVSNLSGFFVEPNNVEFIEEFATRVVSDIKQISNHCGSN